MYKRKINSPEELWEYWEKYKRKCNNAKKKIDKKLTITEGDNQVVNNVKGTEYKPLIYTITGLCSFIGISREAYNKTYRPDPDYKEIIEIIDNQCESDNVDKFVQGYVSPALAGLLLSKYGYGTKEENDTNITAENNLFEIISKSVGNKEENEEENEE